MKYNIKVTNRETKTVFYHNGLTREEISWISGNPNLIVEVRSESNEDLSHHDSSEIDQ